MSEPGSGTSASASARLSQMRVFRPEYYARYRPRTALDIVLQTPGFELALDSTQRGLDGAVGNVLINGVRPPAKVAPITEVLSAIPAEDVQMVMLVPPGSLDVDMGGHPLLLYLATSTEGGIEGDIAVRIGNMGRDGETSMLTADIRSGTPYRTMSVNLDKSHTRTLRAEGMLVSPLFGASAPRRTGGVEMTEGSRQLGATAQWKWPSGELLQGRVNLSLSSMAQSPVPEGGGDAVDMAYTQDIRGGDIAIDWQRPLGGVAGELELTGLRSLKETRLMSSIRDADQDVMTWQDSRSGETALRGAIRLKPDPDWHMQLGVDHAFNFMDGDMRYIVQGQEIPLPGATSQVDESRGGAFMQATWMPNDKITAESSLRWEYSSLRNRIDDTQDAQFEDWLPRASLGWNLQPGEKITANLERKVGQLAFSQFLATVNVSNDVVTAGALSLEPERSWLGEVAYEKRFDETGLFRLGVVRERIDNPVDVVVLDDAIQITTNVQPAVIDTLDVQLNLPMERFGVPGGVLTLSQREVSSRMTDPVTNERREVGRRPSSKSLTFRQDLPGGPLAWGGSIAGGSRQTVFAATSIAETEMEGQISVFGEWRMATSARLRLGYSKLGGYRMRSYQYLAPRRAGAAPDLAYVHEEWKLPMWNATLEWTPRAKLRVDVGMSSSAKRRAGGQVIAPEPGPLIALESSTRTTVTAEVRYGW